MRLAFAIALAVALAPGIAAAQRAVGIDHERVHAVPIRYADRPMTLPEGSFRLDQGIVFRPATLFGVSGPNALYVGLTDWLEIGLAWPYTRDPTFLATARLAHSSIVDFGLRVAVTAPAITTGDTVLVVTMPVVFRVAHVMRITTGVSADFLLTRNVSSILRVPMELAFTPGAERHSFGLTGAVSLADHRFWHGEVGVFYAATPSATPLRPIGEVRLGTTFEISPFVVAITLGFSFWATVNPVQ